MGVDSETSKMASGEQSGEECQIGLSQGLCLLCNSRKQSPEPTSMDNLGDQVLPPEPESVNLLVGQTARLERASSRKQAAAGLVVCWWQANIHSLPLAVCQTF